MRNYWAIPMLLLFPYAILAQLQVQSQQKWKEYEYPDDGFAVTLPYATSPHKDAHAQDINIYTVRLERGTVLSLRAANRPMDCAESFKMLKSGSSYNGQWS